MQQIISKGCVKIKVFSDLFKLRNAVNLKKNPLQKKQFLGVGGGPQMTLWKGNSKGWRVKTKEPSMGGEGRWIFSGITQYDTCYFFGEGVQYLYSEKMLTVTHK